MLHTKDFAPAPVKYSIVYRIRFLRLKLSRLLTKKRMIIITTTVHDPVRPRRAFRLQRISDFEPVLLPALFRTAQPKRHPNP